MESGGEDTTRASYINARDKYRPVSIRFLIVAESPPSSGGYFYFDYATRHDYLFKETMKALGIIPESVNTEEGFHKEPYLRQFQERGFFLIDAVYTPTGEFTYSEKRRIVNDGLSELVDEIKSLNPDWIVIVKASIFDIVRNRLIASGLGDRIVNTEAIPFPSQGPPTRYREMIKTVIASVESCSDDRDGERTIRELKPSSGIDDDDLLEKEFLNQRILPGRSKAESGPGSGDDDIEKRFKESDPSVEERAGMELSHIETKLRDLIAASLTRRYGSNCYKQGVPQDVKERIERTMDKDTSTYPYKAAEIRSSPLRFLEYTNINDLARIITWSNNWNDFKEVFRNIEETKRRIEQLQTYRNHVMHHRKLDEVVVNDGRAAMSWFLKCVECSQVRTDSVEP